MQILSDIAPPEIKCVPVVTHYLNGTTSDIVTWALPEVEDNRNSNLTVLLNVSGPSPGDVLTAGKYEVTYIAQDEEGNFSPTCRMVINVKGMVLQILYRIR